MSGYCRVNMKKAKAALVRWAGGGVTKSEKVGQIILEGDACYSYGRHFLLATRHPDTDTFVVIHDSYFINGRRSSMTEQHKRAVHSALSEYLGDSYDDHVVNVEYAWGPRQTVGQALAYQVRANLSGEATPAMMKHWRGYLEPSTKRLRHSLWGGDPQKLRDAIGAQGSTRFDLAVVEYLIHYKGLEAAMEFTGDPDYRGKFFRNVSVKEAIDDLLIRAELQQGLVVGPLGSLKKTMRVLLGQLRQVRGEARHALAAEWLLSCNRFRKQIATEYFLSMNYKPTKEVA